MVTRPVPLPHGECHLWWAGPTAMWARLEYTLPELERVRALRFGRSADQARYVTARAVTRIALAGYLGCEPRAIQITAQCKRCGSSDHGKPRLAAPGTDLEISLSHSGDRVVVAVVHGVPVGIDVQELPRYRTPPEVVHHLSTAEQATLDQLPEGERPTAVLRYFCRKEAILKATGDGLTVPLARMTVSPPGEPARLLAWNVRRPLDSPVQLHDLSSHNDAVAAIALLTDASHEIIERDGNQLLATC